MFFSGCIWFVFVLCQACTHEPAHFKESAEAVCAMPNDPGAGTLPTRLKLAARMDEEGDRQFLAKRYNIAEVCYKNALTLRQTSPGGLHISMVDSFYRLATLHEVREDYKDAILLYRRAINLLGRASQPQPHRMQAFQCYLAAIQHHGSTQSSLENVQNSLMLYRRVYGSQNAFVGATYHTLAKQYLINKNYLESEKAFNQAKRIIKQYCGKNHLYYMVVLKDFAKLLQITNRQKQAAQLEKQAESIRSRFPMKQHTKLYN